MRSVILAFLNNIISVCNKAIHVGSKYYQRSKGRRWCRNNNCTLTREQIRQTKEYWNKYTKNFNVVFHKKYSTVNGTFDVRYIPDDLYNSIINPYFNGRARDTSIANKSYYPLLFDCKMPEIVFHKINGVYLNRDYQIISEDPAMALCTEFESIVIKPSVGTCGGKSVKVVNCDYIETIKDAFAQYKTVLSFIVQKVIKQHPKISAIHKSSVNTIRIMTLLINNKVNVLPPVLRMGVNNSFVDNASAGGIVCGILPDGRLKPYAYSVPGERFDTHPQGFVFKDYVIPSLSEAKEMVSRLAQRLPYFRMIAWDVAIGEDAEPILIEANLSQGQLDFMQYNNGPLFGDLTDDVLKEVFTNRF